MLTKICTRCKVEWNLDFFPKRRNTKDKHNSWCKDCMLWLQRKNRQENKEKYRIYSTDYYHKNKQHIKDIGKKYRISRSTYNRNYNYQRHFGVTIKWYNEKLSKQNGVCAVCGNAETRIIHGKICCFAIDHSHITGKVRGLLCSKCNKAIGLLQDSITYTSNAVKYLQEYNNVVNI